MTTRLRISREGPVIFPKPSRPALREWVPEVAGDSSHGLEREYRLSERCHRLHRWALDADFQTVAGVSSSG